MQSITRADLTDWDIESVRETAQCYGLDLDDLPDDQAVSEFADYLDDLEVMSNG